ncbi:MAG: CPBP family intramembrane metalloprotease [Ignavibacteriae bacterium]|nr:CPBP family intramembrane metalloprotease [Ignavibacteriota bacterium]MCB9244333.1 CPBP family intramembrane metalloprotease [Ignavibacteriales bacterium]
MNEPDLNIDPQSGKKFPFENIPPRLYVVLTLFVVFFTYQIIGGFLALSFFGVDDPTGGDADGMRIMTAFSQFMLILAPVLLLSYLQGNKFKDAFKIKRPSLPMVSLSVIGIILIQPAIEAYLYFQNKLIYSLPLGDNVTSALKDLDNMFEEMTIKLVASHSIPELLLVIFVISITPAICEEFFFRGLILKNFERSFKALQAITYTGILFAIFHFHPLNVIPLALLGFFLSYIVHYSGSIYTGIIAHFINNTIAVIAVYIVGTESLSEDVLSGGNEIAMLIYGVISLVLFIIVMRLIKRIASSPAPPADNIISTPPDE